MKEWEINQKAENHNQLDWTSFKALSQIQLTFTSKLEIISK